MKTTRSILRDVDETLLTARQGLRDVLGSDHGRKLGGLRNLVVFGRAVTNVLQNLRSTEPRFDDWYARFVKEMSDDPLLKYFYRLRSEILKRGSMRTSVSVYVNRFEFPRDLQRLGPPPPGAKGFFIGDQTGGSGWEVELPDGSKEKFYVDLPGDIGTTRVELRDAPNLHLGKEASDQSIETLAQLYYDYLVGLVENAKLTFDSPSGPNH